MKNQTNVIKGIAIAFLVYLIGLIVFYYRGNDGQSFLDFFGNPVIKRALLPVLTWASIPNVGLFAWFIQKNKLGFARGILTSIILILGVMAYIKFAL